MKKKTLITAGVIVALVLVLLLAGLPLFSKLYYGRSQAATLFAWQLKKEAYTTEEAFESYLADKREENAGEYQLPEEVEFTVSAVRGSAGGLSYYILNGAADPDAPFIFYFPGGSYIDAPRAVHWQFLDSLAADTGALIVVPLYPRLPDNDAETAYAALTEFYTEFMTGLVHGDIIFMGDSAGGGMALSFAMQLRDGGVQGPDKLILLCPWLDVTLSNPDIPAYEKKDPALDSEQLRHLGVLWAGDLSPADPVVSPLYGDLRDLGSITLITGTGELLYPDIKRMSDILAEQGIGHHFIESSGMFHVWPLYRAYSIPEAEQTYADILRVIGQ